MKKTILLFTLIFIFLSNHTFSQGKENLSIAINGFVGYNVFFDTYKSAESRDGEIYLYPLAANYDLNGQDVNNIFQVGMSSTWSRLKFSINNIEVLGAKLHGVVEGDFLGKSQNYTGMLRLRHAFVQLNWEKTKLLVGKYWHPMFATDCYPEVFSFGAGLPFQPANRASQIRITQELFASFNILGCILIDDDFKSVGPSDAQLNSGIPEIQLQMKYQTDNFLAGITAGYKYLTPRLITNNQIKTNKSIGSYNLQAFTKLRANKFTFKLEGIYGKNLSEFTMIGGYGASQDPTLTDDYNYSNINTCSFWSECYAEGEKFLFGIFGGYSQNLGSDNNYYSIGYARNDDLNYIYRISPRVEYKKGKLSFIVEYMITGAAYATDFSNHHKPIKSDNPTINNRTILGAKYTF